MSVVLTPDHRYLEVETGRQIRSVTSVLRLARVREAPFVGTGAGGGPYAENMRRALKRGSDVHRLTRSVDETGSMDDALFDDVFDPADLCLGVQERVLTADLRWVPCGDVRRGDKVFGFDEEVTANRWRRWKIATVTASTPSSAECVRVYLADGSEVVCTTNHPWLVRPVAGLEKKWVRADELCTAGRHRSDGYFALRAFHPWEPETTYDAGWLAGMFDGEGWICAGNDPHLGFCQKPGPTLTRMEHGLKALGIRYAIQRHKSGVVRIAVSGGFASILECLGRIRPLRLIEGLGQKWSSRGVQSTLVKVLRVERVGRRAIQRLSTSSRTYVGEGFLMHNSAENINFVAAYERFLRTSGYRPLAWEIVLWSQKLDYAGRADAVGWLGANRVMLDRKTGSVDKSVWLQLAGYRLAWNEMHPTEPIDKTYALLLLSDQSFKLLSNPLEPGDAPYWLAALWMARWHELSL
jgi:hypothetical protein